MTTEERVPDDPAPLAPGEPSPPPLLFLFVVWFGAMSVVVWAMTRVFGRSRSRGPEPEDPGD